MTTPLPIQDQGPKPPGLLPKNVQSWLLAGLAVLMVLIMWLTGEKKPRPHGSSAPPGPVVQAPLEVNEAKIVELQNRIAELQREQALAQNALAQQTAKLADASGQHSSSSSATDHSGSERTEDPLRAERKRRDYLSLFASNVALSFRKASGPAPAGEIQSTPTAGAADSSAQLAELLKPLAAPAVPSPAQTKAQIAESDRKEEPLKAPAAAQPVRAGAKTYLLFEGTIVEAVLINRLDGQFSGPVECVSTTDLYSHDRQHLLVPAGSKLLGEARKVEAFGQFRLAVAFHRLVMPDGYSVSLDHFQGLDQAGNAGLRDQVNNHYLRIFGTSLALGAIGATAEQGTSGALTATGSDLMRQEFAHSVAQSSSQILDHFLNVLPTVTIREGHRIKVYLSGDLALPDYSDHATASNL
jgi:type IV secretion system protein TrbI